MEARSGTENTNNETHMRKTFSTAFLPSFAAALCLCAAGACLVGCESDDTVGGKIVDAVKDDDKKSGNLSGTWTGVSGSGNYPTTVTISDNHGSLSGSLRWSWGGTRKFSGTRSGSNVTWTNQADEEGVRDTWVMKLSSDGKKLTGRATKTTGGGYSISLSR